MRILYICRVFSGFETSLAKRFWQPTGAPTIYKVMEALDQSNHDVYFLMPCKGFGLDYRTQWNKSSDQTIKLDGLRLPITVLASENRYPDWFGRLRGPLTTLRHLWRIIRIAASLRPHFVYVDRANVIAGALLAHLFRIPIVLRVMGVYPSMWDSLSENSLASRLTRWAYKAPFSLVICTQDGSGGEFWLPQALQQGVPYQMLLNGRAESGSKTPLDPRLTTLPKDRTIVLFVGRFETIKGCSEFADAILALHASSRHDIHAIMIGTGHLYNAVRARVHAAGAEAMFTFIDRLPHSQIAEAHRRSDIYISLNRLGQLSNANIEAMSMGACMVVPQSQPDRGIDVTTEKLVNGDAVLRIPWDNQIEALVNTICLLAEDPDRRHTLQSNVKATAEILIQSWDERIAKELDLIGNYIGRPF